MYAAPSVLDNIPTDKVMLCKWLESGFVFNRQLFPTEEGAPQGGIISPTLANMALDGLQAMLAENFKLRRTKMGYFNPMVNLVRYADDFIITCSDREILESQIKPAVSEFLQARGLTLSEEKTKITHIDEGFDFLGFNIRKYKGTLLIKPSKKNVKEFLAKIKSIVRKNQAIRQDKLIGLLNPVITGWGNYYKGCVAAKTFKNADAQIFYKLWAWVEPIAEIGEIAKEHGVLFHTDAVQAYAQVPINVDEMHIDMLSASGHKLNGPKGIGFLYIRKGVKIRSFVHGGAQERSRRAGTENIPGIVGLGAAVERAMRIMDTKTRKEIELRDYLIGRLENEIPHCWLNGHRTKRLPNNINFSFLFIEGESMLIMLDMKGICASSGSACTSGSLDPSHVLLAIGLKHEEAHGSLRLTLSEESTKEEMDIVAEEVKKIVQRLRDMSPLYEDFLKSQKNN